MGRFGHTERVATKQRPDNAVKPRRRHRRIEPWLNVETGRPADLSPAERDDQRRVSPLLALLRVLAADEPFLTAVEHIRDGRETVDRVAAMYVWREGRARHTMRRLLERVVASPGRNPQARVLGIGTTASWVNAQVESRRWPRGDFTSAAAMLARRGSQRCLVCGSQLARDGGRRLYCGSHDKDASVRTRADGDAILGLLEAVDAALGRSE